MSPVANRQFCNAARRVAIPTALGSLPRRPPLIRTAPNRQQRPRRSVGFVGRSGRHFVLIGLLRRRPALADGAVTATSMATADPATGRRWHSDNDSVERQPRFWVASVQSFLAP